MKKYFKPLNPTDNSLSFLYRGTICTITVSHAQTHRLDTCLGQNQTRDRWLSKVVIKQNTS